MPALLLTAYCRLKETKLPSFLVYVNWKDEESLLKVACNKQQRIKIPCSCERSQRRFRFWVKEMLVWNVNLELCN